MNEISLRKKASLGLGAVVKNNKRNQKDIPMCSRKASERVCSETQVLSNATYLFKDLNRWLWDFFPPMDHSDLLLRIGAI